MGNIKTSKSCGLWIILGIYLFATAIGVWVFQITEGLNPLVRLFRADFWATIAVWIFGVLLRNSSVYDPYWSVAPPILLTGYALYCAAFNLPVILLLAVVWYWGIRLTANWGYTFKNFQVQDWRYDMYKERFPRVWQMVNLFGINLMPTVVVFFAMIPAILLIELNPIVISEWAILGALVCAAAASLQWKADCQAHRFRNENPGKVCCTGLWKSSRHPNYLGEILMWWGVAIMYVAFVPSHWYTIFGAVVVTCLFLFISIPMMEKRQMANKPEYAEYKKRTRVLF